MANDPTSSAIISKSFKEWMGTMPGIAPWSKDLLLAFADGLAGKIVDDIYDAQMVIMPVVEPWRSIRNAAKGTKG